MARQLPLRFSFGEHARLANFVVGRNAACLQYLRQLPAGGGESISYLWGAAASGKTHLLQALGHDADAAGMAVVYLPCAQYRHWQPAILDELEHYPLVCLDDIDRLCGQRPWEEALFHLINRVRERAGHRLLLAARPPLRVLAPQLPDLASRLAWGMVFQVQELDEADKSTALQLRARNRGFSLADDVIQYLLRYYARDMASMCGLLDRIDYASLAEQRRITLPFVRQTLQQSPAAP